MNPNLVEVHKGLIVLGGIFAFIGALIVVMLIYVSVESDISDWWRKYQYNKKSARRERFKKYLACHYKGKALEKAYMVSLDFLSRDNYL